MLRRYLPYYVAIYTLALLNHKILGQETYHFLLSENFSASHDAEIQLEALANDEGNTGNFESVSVPATTCESVTTTKAYYFEDMAGLAFSNNDFLDCEYSIQFTFKINELVVREGTVSSDWVQLLEFRHDRMDRGLYLIIDKETEGRATLNFWQLNSGNDEGTSVRIGEDLFFDTENFYQMTLIRNCTGEVQVFINGDRFGESYIDANNIYATTSASDKLYFFRDMPDDVYNNEASPGYVKNLIVSNYEWSTEEIAKRWETFCLQLEDVDFEVSNLCEGDNTQFQITSDTSGIINVEWDFGDPASGSDNLSNELNPQHIFSSNGTYIITSALEYEFITKTVADTLSIFNNPSIDLGSDLEILEGESIIISAPLGYRSYEWKDGNTNPNMSTNEASTIWLQVEDDNGCMGRDTVEVAYREKLPLVVPNTITPNFDGINDRWIIENIEDYFSNEIIIVDRYGSPITTLNNYQNNWRGIVNGTQLPEGTYYYFFFNEGNLEQKGSISIIR